MSLVLDSSVTLAWVYPDETTPWIERIFALVEEDGAWVPELWRLEVANTLEMGVRRGRTGAAFRDDTFRDLPRLPIRVDPETNRHAWGATLQLAIRHRLTLYGAAYVELAQRRRLPLATLDRDLRAAARAEGIELLGDDA
ncbi:MAG TPA: type II toxin-antitoxin system VapC family toxin [Candidatus Sulfopaludibacter sp.]|nr:type II toxin-antitoxin system VapC family toxin [Candidatus Sulfopaludibacter sp.]